MPIELTLDLENLTMAEAISALRLLKERLDFLMIEQGDQFGRVAFPADLEVLPVATLNELIEQGIVLQIADAVAYSKYDSAPSIYSAVGSKAAHPMMHIRIGKEIKPTFYFTRRWIDDYQNRGARRGRPSKASKETPEDR